MPDSRCAKDWQWNDAVFFKGWCVSQSERPSRGWTWEGPETRVFLALFPLLFFTNKNFWRKSILSSQLIKSWAITRFKHLFFMDETVGMIWDFSICVLKEIRFLTEWQCHLGYGAPLAALLSCCLGGSVIQTDTDLNASLLHSVAPLNQFVTWERRTERMLKVKFRDNMCMMEYKWLTIRICNLPSTVTITRPN